METKKPATMSATDFIQCVRNHLSTDRHILLRYDAGFCPAAGRGVVTVNFYNLPESRVQERRGNGAEVENNRQLFMIWGFNETADSPVAKVKIEQDINGIGSNGAWAPNLRAKTASPEKVAIYLAQYINKVAADFAPYLFSRLATYRQSKGKC